MLTVKKVIGKKSIVTMVNCFMLSFWRAPMITELLLKRSNSYRRTVSIENQIDHIVGSSPHLV